MKLPFVRIAAIFLLIAGIGPSNLPGLMEKDSCHIVPCVFAASEPQFTREGQLTFLQQKSKKKITSIDIEIADTDYERMQGLMFRHSMPRQAGMLFIFERSEPRSFWMRNTYIPLDIIFADEKGRIITIHKKTKPLSYETIRSSNGAKYVVEVNAGFCDQHGIHVGDWIRF